MKDVNLIPPDRLEARRSREVLRFWGIVNAGAVVLLVAGLGAAAATLRAEKAALVDLDGRVAGLQELRREMGVLRAERSLLDEEAGAVRSLLDRRPDEALVRAIAGAVEDRAWLSLLELERPVSEWQKDPVPGTLKLSGQAGSYRHLARLMDSLDSLDFVSYVDLAGSEQVIVEDVEAIRFDIECGVEPGQGGRS
jgi:Tfp pilus assembly protein PilN